jgi:hypothetical protein
MTRILTLLASLIVGKLLGDAQRASVLVKLPMLMVRKIIQLFFVGFGFLLTGIIALGLLLREVMIQLQDRGQVFFSPAMWVASGLMVLAFIGCGLALRRKIWLKPDSSLDSEPQPTMDPTNALSTLLMDFLEDRKARRAADKIAQP